MTMTANDFMFRMYIDQAQRAIKRAYHYRRAAGLTVPLGLAGLLRMEEEVNNLGLPKPKPKEYKFECGCGCGEVVTTTYLTKKPKYVNRSHYMRVWRRQKRAEENEKTTS